MRLILEERFLFDASLARTTHHVNKMATEHDGSHHVPTKASENAHSIVFIDNRVSGWQTLASGVKKNVDVVVIDSSKDGISQISNALKKEQNLTSISILGYGKPGELYIGSNALTEATVENNKSIASWSDHMTNNGQILLWGCDVGHESDLVKAFDDTTKKDTSASDSAVGDVWKLADINGKENNYTPFTLSAEKAYNSVLDTPVPTVTLSTSTSATMPGNSFQESLNFTNTAVNAIGYAPFVELYVPNNSSLEASLSSATYLGQNLSFQKLTLSDTVAGHEGTVGVLNPKVKDSKGKAEFVVAPTGYVAGDSLYILKLPLESVVPNQNMSNVLLNFTISDSSEPTFISNKNMNITAIGGFANGQNPVYDVTKSVPVRGTDIDDTNVTTSTNGMVSTSIPVKIVDVNTTLSTVTGENRTPVGSQHPVSYVVSVTPASATDKNPLTNYQVRVTLPDGVNYSGGNIDINGAKGTATVEGNVVTINFPSIDDTNGSTTVKIPAITQQDIVSSNNDYRAVLPSPTVTYKADDWTQGGKTTAISGSGNNSNAILNVRAFTIDDHANDPTVGISNGIIQFFPGDINYHTVNVNLANTYNSDNAVLSIKLSDGQTINPNSTYKFTYGSNTLTFTLDQATLVSEVIHGQTVYASGSGNNFSFTRDKQTGETTLTFNVAQENKAETGNSAFTHGTHAQFNYTTQILNHYTVINNQEAITENDNISDVTTLSGSLLDGKGKVLTSYADSDTVNQVVPKGAVGISIVKINDTNPTTSTIGAGDNITYQANYALETGTFNNLKLTTYLPGGIFNVVDPANNGSDLTFTSGDGTVVGEYKLVNAPEGVTIKSVSVNKDNNSIVFDLGSNDGTPVSGKNISIQFTVKAAHLISNSNVSVIAQQFSEFTNAASSTYSSAALSSSVMEQPSVTMKTGIVSVVNADGTNDSNITYTNEVDSSQQTPSTIYASAGSSTVFTGVAPTSLDEVEDIDASSVHGGEIARIATTVKAGSDTANGDVYNLIVSGSLPTGIDASNISNFQIVRSDGTVMSFTKPDGSVAKASDFFNGGIKILNGTDSVLTGSGGTSSVLSIIYDVKIPVNTSLGHSELFTSSVDNYTNSISGSEYVVNGTPIGGNSADLTDDATSNFVTPTISKTIGSSNVSENDNIDSNYQTMVPGEVRPVSIIVKVPSGSLTNNGNDVVIKETLPSGLNYVAGSGAITLGNGVTITGNDSVVLNGNVLEFHLGTSVDNLGNRDNPGQITLTYNTYLANTHVDNDVLSSTASLSYDGKVVPDANVSIIEHDPALTIKISDTGNGDYYSGQAETYNVTVTNNSKLTAFNSVLDLVANSNLKNIVVKDSNINIVDPTNINIGTLKAGDSKTFTVTGNIVTGLPVNSKITVTGNLSWASVASGDGQKEYTTSAEDTDTTQDLSTRLYVVGNYESSNQWANSLQTDINSPIGDIAVMRGVVQFAPGNNSGVTLTLNVPDGVSIDTNNIKIGFITPDGNGTSSTISGAGIAEGTTRANPYSVALTQLVPASAITVSNGKIVINLGDISNNNVSNLKSYIAIEFGERVKNVASNVNGALLATTLVTSSGDNSWTSESEGSKTYLTVTEPNIVYTKKIVSIDQSTGTITFQDVITNKGNVTAYNTTLNDNIASSNEHNISNVVATGGGINTSITGNDTKGVFGSFDLGAGKTETITYSVTAIDKSKAIPVSTSTVTYQSVPTSVDGENTTGGENSARDGSGTLAVDTYKATVNIGFGTANGQVWQALGTTPGTYDSALDTALSNAEIDIKSSGNLFVNGTALTQKATINSNGNWTLGLIPNGSYTVGVKNIPSNETIVYNSVNGNASIPSMTAKSDFKTLNLAYEVPNTAPFVSGDTYNDVTSNVVSNVYVNVLKNANVTDKELDKLIDSNEWSKGYGGFVINIKEYDNSGNVVPLTGQFDNISSEKNVSFPITLDKVVANYIRTDNAITITMADGTSKSDLLTILNDIAYSPQSDGNGLILFRHIGVSVSDGNDKSIANGITGAQGTGGVQTSNLIEIKINSLPSNIADVTYQKPNNTDHMATAVPVLSNLTIDTSGDMVSGAVVKITNAIAEDRLTFGSVSGITGNYDANTGTLTFTGTASASVYQSLLKSVAYFDVSEIPYINRTPTINATVTVDNVNYTFDAAKVTILNANDSPVLNTNVNVQLNDASELNGDSTTPIGTVGTKISSLVSLTNNVTDPDGSSVINGNPVGSEIGLAIVSADTSHGSWYYSTDNGTTWTVFASASNPLSTSNALRLSNDANNRIVFVPTDKNWNGKIDNALSFRAWNVGEGGDTMPTSGYGTGINTDGSAYSANIKTVSETVDAINNAPIASGSNNVTLSENEIKPQTISSLYSRNFNDSTDAQQTTDNPTGSVANTLAGVAIIGNTTLASEGLWQYQATDGTWKNISFNLSDTNSLVLSNNTQVRFLTNANYNGEVTGKLTVRLLDSSNDVVLSNGTKASTLSNTITALTNIDVSNNGGNTAISKDTVDTTVNVTAINNAPLANNSVPVIIENEGDNATEVNSNIIVIPINSLSSYFDDSLDNQKTAINPTGSVANTLAGIAIVGNNTPTSEGSWQYESKDGTWHDIGTVSDTNSLILSNDLSIRFNTSINFNGSPKPLTIRLIDSSSDVSLSSGITSFTGQSLLNSSNVETNVDVSNNGNDSSISKDTIDLTVNIKAVNTAPTVIGNSITIINKEGEGADTSYDIKSLYTKSFNDSADTQQTTDNPTGSVANTLAGIAVVGNNIPTSEGIFQYEGSDGTWHDINSNVSDKNALILGANTNIRFVTNDPNFNGNPEGNLTIRLIDSSDTIISGAVTGQSLANTANAYTGIDVSNNGGNTAISKDTVDTTVNVTAINNAPIVSGNTQFATQTEDVAISSANGISVTNLLSNVSFDDSADAQQTTDNPTGSVANALAGIAIVGNNTTSSEGVFQYESTDGTWKNIGTDVSNTNALVLGSDTNIRFIPNANYNGIKTLEFRAIDSSDTIISGAVTGQSLANTANAYTGIDVSNNGGNTAISAQTITSDITVLPINDRPIATGTASLTDTLEENSISEIKTVNDLYNTNYSDSADNQKTDTNPYGSVSATFAGVAIVGNNTPASEGSWQYQTTDGTWKNVGSVSDTNSLILGSNISIRFNPALNFNGQPDPLTVRLISNPLNENTSSNLPLSYSVPDGVKGVFLNTSFINTNVSLNDLNDTSSVISQNKVDTNINVIAINNAPVISGSLTLYSEQEGTTNYPVTTLKTLGSQSTFSFDDSADNQKTSINPTGSVANTLAGFAIVGNDALASEGTFRYQGSDGKWHDIGTDVSDTNALVLGNNSAIIFVPANAYYNGTKTLTIRAIDSSDTVITGTTTGQSLANTANAYTGIDVSNNGGNTAISEGKANIAIDVMPVNNAPVVVGTSVFPSVEENSISEIKTVNDLYNANYSDVNDSQKTDTNPNGSNSATLAGVAIVGNNTPTSEGSWQYQTTDGTWKDIGTVSDKNSLILGNNIGIRFNPALNFNGQPDPLTVRLISNINSEENGLKVTYNAPNGISDLPSNSSFIASNIDVTTNGGNSIISSDILNTNINVISINHAPIISGSASLTNELEDVSSNYSSIQVSDIFKQATFNDSADNQKTAINPTGSVANTLAGIAIIGNNTPTSEGSWQYESKDGTWHDINSNVSDKNALILGSDLNIRFVPGPDYNGIRNLKIRAIDSSSELKTTDVAEMDVSTNGGNTAISAQTVDISITVNAGNDAPIATGETALNDMAQNTVSSGETVADIWGNNFSNNVDNQKTDTNPYGSVSATFAGVAIVGNNTPTSEGSWQYQTTDGTWKDVGTVSDNNALALGSNISIRFNPSTNFNGQPDPLIARLISDPSNEVPSGYISYGLPSALSPMIGNAKFDDIIENVNIAVDNGQNDHMSIVSADTVNANITITPINHAPDIDGILDVSSETENKSPLEININNVAKIFNDSLDAQQTTDNPTGSVANTLAGVAIVGNNTPASEGSWQYQTTDGTWKDIGTVSDTNAVILNSNSIIRFNPSTNFNGQPDNLIFRIIDSSKDVAVFNNVTGQDILQNNIIQDGVDVSVNGGDTAISDKTSDFAINITSVNNAPDINGNPTNVVTKEDMSSSGNTVQTIFNSIFDDSADNQKTNINPTGSIANTLAGVAIVGNNTPTSEGSWQYQTTDGTWKDIGTVSDKNGLVLGNNIGIRFNPALNFNGQPDPLTVRLIDSSDTTLDVNTIKVQDVSANGGDTAISKETVDYKAVIDAVNNAPEIDGVVQKILMNEGDNTSGMILGQTVSDLVSSVFDDSLDNQKTAINPTGSVANTLVGIIITGNQTSSDLGYWAYSVDNKHWIAIKNVSDTNALVLSSDTHIAFIPSDKNFNGEIPGLTAHLIDNSQGDVTNGIQSLTETGHDSAISTDIVHISADVLAANNAPVIVNGNNIEMNINENNRLDMTVQTIYASHFSDDIDNQKSDSNPTGSIPSNFAGIAITSSGITKNGIWSYQGADGTWHDIGNNISSENALILGDDTKMRFTPSVDFNGYIPSLSTHLISDYGHDVKSDTIRYQSLTDLGSNSIYSNDSIILGIRVTPVTQAPIISSDSISTQTSYETEKSEPVASIISGYNDQRNQNMTIDNPTGTNAYPLGGIVITGLTTKSNEGTWTYTLNNQTFVIPETVSFDHAIVLPKNAIINFIPSSGFTGVASLTVSAFSDSPGMVGNITGHEIVQLDMPLTNVNLNNATVVSNSHEYQILVEPKPIVPPIVPPTPIEPVPAPPVVPPVPAPVEPSYRGGRPILSDSTVRNGMSRDALNAYRGYDIWHDSGIKDHTIDSLYGIDLATSFNTITMNSWTLPSDAIRGDFDNLVYEARCEDGSQLPAWLTFDPRTQTFSGSPPEGESDLRVIVSARNMFGLTTYVHVNFIIEEPATLLTDLLGRLMRDNVIMDTDKHKEIKHDIIHKNIKEHITKHNKRIDHKKVLDRLIKTQ